MSVYKVVISNSILTSCQPLGRLNTIRGRVDIEMGLNGVLDLLSHFHKYSLKYNTCHLEIHNLCLFKK